ncbi:hypothetical protein LBMAG37_16720 [Anaerolineae bacterium]|nr:hypothetical protein LBMAG37_16720 [Anaerolineae bacterium]
MAPSGTAGWLGIPRGASRGGCWTLRRCGVSLNHSTIKAYYALDSLLAALYYLLKDKGENNDYKIPFDRKFLGEPGICDWHDCDARACSMCARCAAASPD